MVLYVSIVLLAELDALPADYAVSNEGSPRPGPPLLVVVWGTAVGLAVAHWLAFQVASVWYSGGKVVKEDLERAAAQIAGALIVATATTVPILLADSASEVRAAAFAPASLLGAAGYFTARAARRSGLQSALAGLLVLALGMGAAVLKSLLGSH